MREEGTGASSLGRRGFIQLTAAGVALTSAIGAAASQPSETASDMRRQPAPSFTRG
jgi:hypothetical protein